MIVHLERWTLTATDDIEISSQAALEAILDPLQAGEVFMYRPCGEHGHLLLLQCPLEAALDHSDVPHVYTYIGAGVGSVREPSFNAAAFEALLPPDEPTTTEEVPE